MSNIQELRDTWKKMVESVNTVNLDLGCDARCNLKFSSGTGYLCYLVTEGNLKPTYKEGSEQESMWRDMIYFYGVWTKNASTATCAYKKRFVKIASDLIRLDPEFPFAVPFEEPSATAEQEEAAAAEPEYEEVAAEELVPAEEPNVVENVVEDPPHKFFNTRRKMGRR